MCLCVCITFSWLSICLWTLTWFLSLTWLLWILLQWTCSGDFSFILGFCVFWIYTQMCNYWTIYILFLIFEELSCYFFEWLDWFTLHKQCTSFPFTNTCLFIKSHSSSCGDSSWLVLISLMISYVEHLWQHGLNFVVQLCTFMKKIYQLLTLPTPH